MSSRYGGYAGKVLRVDLTTREVDEYPWIDADRALYLGGKIMAAKILYDNIAAGTDAYAPDNLLVVSTGPLTGTSVPSSSRFNISAISPLTGLCASSNCGGDFGLKLKKAGYDALVIKGKATAPVWIEITEEDVVFHEAGDLWGKTTGETQEALGEGRGKIVIGPAGEHLVRYACVFSGDRTAGRTGMGAVMGAKNLKAVTATGSKSATVHNRDRLKKVVRGWVKLLKEHPLTGDALPKYGTGFLLRLMQQHRLLATRNYKYGQFKDYDMLSGQTLAEKYLIRNVGCTTCIIKCGRLVEVNGKRVKGPELETLGLLGPNLENNDLERIMQWNYQLDELGMDTISTGGCIGFAMELQEKGLWDCGLAFGKTDRLAEIMEDIAYRRGIGDQLAEGTKRLAQRFGGGEFAIHAKGLELAAYEPRGAVGQGLGYATANRGGCHLNAGYMVLMEGLGLGMNPYTTRAKAAMNVLNQNLMEGVSAAGCCLFPLFSFYPGWLISHQDSLIGRIVNAVLPYSGATVNLLNKLPGRFLPIHLPLFPYTKALSAVTGMKVTVGALKDMGERGFNLERLLNIRMGLTAADDGLPKRLTDEPQVEGDPRTCVHLGKMKKQYYKIRGWDASGVPTERKKKSLRLV
ncbi:MAG TPA: aldehyde ferredoxin oxidoreductase family protein [Candidatus Hydrogenedentes bacterium]|nr:aldehyde ferredoxin oxidoreductase family protein [Candidatus Hydrogenedentota bacterium]